MSSVGKKRGRSSESKSSTEVDGLLQFLRDSPSQFHVVQSAISMLDDAGGFTQLSEKDDNSFRGIKPGGRYYLTRNQSSLIAFTVGKNWSPGKGFAVMAAHTDSPVLKVKPVSNATGLGCRQVGVECYGGGLWHTWFDRDLSVAGRAIVRAEGGELQSRLVRVNQPLLRVPMLAIHLNRTIYSDGFKPNKQTHLAPILASSVGQQVGESKGKQHHSELMQAVVDSLNQPPSGAGKKTKTSPVAVDDVVGFELSLYDTQEARLIGARNEFVTGQGLDNKCMSFVCMRALLDSLEDGGDDDVVRMVALFDNEEVGSVSNMGANSDYLPSVLRRITRDAEHESKFGSFEGAMRRSVLISADMAHAVHPNYPEKHEKNHRPLMHGGLVIKQNANQRYATNSWSQLGLQQVASAVNVPLQQFVVRNDMGCGSTVGPCLSSRLGIQTVDVGIAQLAMHSLREMCGASDVTTSVTLLREYFSRFSKQKIFVD